MEHKHDAVADATAAHAVRLATTVRVSAAMWCRYVNKLFATEQQRATQSVSQLHSYIRRASALCRQTVNTPASFTSPIRYRPSATAYSTYSYFIYCVYSFIRFTAV